MSEKKVFTEQEQREILEELRRKVIDETTTQYTREEVEEGVRLAYANMGKDMPEVVICDSPHKVWHAAVDFHVSQGRKKDSDLISECRPYVGEFWRCWSGWYRGGEILGAEFDKDTLEMFVKFVERCRVWHATDTHFFVSKSPVECHWRGDELHNENGMAVKYADGTGVWEITNIAVDEQIVMRPETQTIDQLLNEENEEVKRIRIERFGWDRFLLEAGAEVLDSQTAQIGGWLETLMRAKNGMVVLCTYDPSTGRPYTLEVDPDIKTCTEAQRYLSGADIALGGLDVKPTSAYPVLRT